VCESGSDGELNLLLTANVGCAVSIQLRRGEEQVSQTTEGHYYVVQYCAVQQVQYVTALYSTVS
jgi:hypothetical protein